MMNEILVGDFLIVLYAFLRIAAMLFAAPVFSNSSFLPTGKIFLAIVISYIAFLTIDKSTIPTDISFYGIVFTAVKEIITGYIMGFMLNFIFMAVSFAGHYIGFDMGLMMSEVLNPFQETNNNVIGEFIYYAAMMVFFVINGHHYIISGVVYSFKLIPIGKYTITSSLVDLMIKYSFSVFTIALKIASPVLVSFFLIHIAEGIIARVIPNIQVFFITQPAKIAIGILMLISLLPIYVFVIKRLLEGYQDQLNEIINAMSV